MTLQGTVPATATLAPLAGGEPFDADVMHLDRLRDLAVLPRETLWVTGLSRDLSVALERLRGRHGPSMTGTTVVGPDGRLAAAWSPVLVFSPSSSWSGQLCV